MSQMIVTEVQTTFSPEELHQAESSQRRVCAFTAQNPPEDFYICASQEVT